MALNDEQKFTLKFFLVEIIITIIVVVLSFTVLRTYTHNVPPQAETSTNDDETPETLDVFDEIHIKVGSECLRISTLSSPELLLGDCKGNYWKRFSSQDGVTISALEFHIGDDFISCINTPEPYMNNNAVVLATGLSNCLQVEIVKIGMNYVIRGSGSIGLNWVILDPADMKYKWSQSATSPANVANFTLTKIG